MGVIYGILKMGGRRTDRQKERDGERAEGGE